MNNLIRIEKTDHLDIDLVYATENNITKKKIYDQTAACYLMPDAAEKLFCAAKIAAARGYHLKIWDAYRPPEAQEVLWEAFPDQTFVTPPTKGSAHTRGVAVDLTICNDRKEVLNMGTDFDDFSAHAFHTYTKLAKHILRNRLMLLGIMTLAGWDFFENEWWHYQLHATQTYPLIQGGFPSS